MLKQRIFTAIVLLSILFTAIWFAPAGLIVLVVVAIGIAAWEWGRLGGLSGQFKLSGYSFFCVITLLLFLDWASILAGTGKQLILPNNDLFIVSASVFWLIVSFYFMYLKFSNKQQQPGINTSVQPAILLLGVWILLVAGMSVFWLHQQGVYWLMLMMGAVIFSDIGGYFAGKYMGSHLLLSQVSPKKTIEGVLGGLLLNVLFGIAVMSYQLLPELATWQLFLLILMGSLMTVIGDLWESWMKRRSAIKDSGGLLPGHGGVLDRIDGLCATAPVMVTILLLIQSR